MHSSCQTFSEDGVKLQTNSSLLRWKWVNSLTSLNKSYNLRKDVWMAAVQTPAVISEVVHCLKLLPHIENCLDITAQSNLQWDCWKPCDVFPGEDSKTSPGWFAVTPGHLRVESRGRTAGEGDPTGRLGFSWDRVCVASTCGAGGTMKEEEEHGCWIPDERWWGIKLLQMRATGVKAIWREFGQRGSRMEFTSDWYIRHKPGAHG